MKKSEKKVKPAKVPAKKMSKAVAHGPLFKDVKALVKAVLNGEKPRGLKVSLSDAGVSFVYGKSANVAGKDAAIKDILGAIGIKVS